MTAPRKIIYLALPAGRPAYLLIARTYAEAVADAAAVTGPGTEVAETVYAWDYLTRTPTDDGLEPQPRPGTRLAEGTWLYRVTGGPREIRVLAADAGAAAELARGILGTEPGAFTVTSQGNAPLLLADIAAHIAARSAAVPAGSAA